MLAKTDGWTAGTAYEGFMGRWSRALAVDYVSWLKIPPRAHWLDVGCGTGALTSAICRFGEPESVIGCDPSTTFVDYATRHTSLEAASFQVAGVGALPRRPGGYGCVSSLLALNFFPDPNAAIGEMMNLVHRDGVVSACVWDYSGRMEFLRHFWDVVIDIDPDSRDQDEGVRFPICSQDKLIQLFQFAGLAEVRCEALEISTRFVTFEDYWNPLLLGAGPASVYVTSLEEDARTMLAGRLRSVVFPGKDQSVDLVAGSWAVRGVRA